MPAPSLAGVIYSVSWLAEKIAATASRSISRAKAGASLRQTRFRGNVPYLGLVVATKAGAYRKGLA